MNGKQFENDKTRRNLFWALLFLVLLFTAMPAGIAWGQDAPFKIGVLAIRGPEQCLTLWSPTAEYLTRQIAGQRFSIVPLSHDQIYAAAKYGEVDFILANSSFYVGIEYWFQAKRIVTLKERRDGGVYAQYGGVIFCRGDRKEIRSLADLKGKSFMAVSEASLGGWLMAWREFKENKIDPYRDFKALRFSETHDQVVYAVRDRLIDAGTVRTGTLEDLSAEGKIDLADFYVFPRLHPTEEPSSYYCTTREYPGWPMASLKHIPDDLAEKVAVALLQMPADAPAAKAAGSAGWTIPLNYQPVHDCLKVLKVGPYEDLGQISFADVLKKYGPWIILAVIAFCTLAVFTGVVLRLNRRVRNSHARLKAEIDLRKEKDRELKKAKELAEAATRAKSEFLANMSHEIRTPMNGVIAASDLALAEELPPKIENYLKIIHSSAYSLLGIINDILDFSKIEAGKFELKERSFGLNEVFDRVMEQFFSKAAEKGIELLVDCDPDTPEVLKGDPLRLQQILTNLVSNAVKFTEAGGVILVSVKAAQAPTPDEVILNFTVKDTGVGIAPEYRDLLFLPFSQGDTSSTRKYEGTGLGLSICKQLVTLMRGEIGVESELGKGSTFFFSVHLDRPPDMRTARQVLPPDIEGLNVLVVDDLADSRVVMRKMLESMGFRVETLDSGAEALQRLEDNMLRNDPIELILMDWKMPGMDGIETSGKIRRELNLTMPIIMMTAFGGDEQRLEAEKAGINGFLTKPIYPSTLFDAIMDGFGKEGLKSGVRKKQFTTRASMYRKPLKGARILVAEDNPTNQQVAQAILEGAGIVVTIVANGQAAVEAVKNETFDAVLMDIQMPIMNGYEATQSIRQLPQGRSLPIAAMTAHAMKGDEEKCLEAGMDGYVSKPIQQDRLFQTLFRLLRSRADISAEPAPEEEEDAAPAPDAGTLPDRLPGIEIGPTLAALKLDPVTFAHILAGFLADNRQSAEKLKQALADSDPASLRQLAHGLKGSAANIGAHDLRAAAHMLEDAAHRSTPTDMDRSHLEGLVRKVECALGPVLASIQSLAAPAAEAPVAAHSDAGGPAFEALLAQLMEALDRADPEQIAPLVAAVGRQALPAGRMDKATLAALEAKVGRYDYDQALEILRKISP